MPDHAIDNTGKIFRSAEEVKNIYLKEGTLFLKKKLEAPGPEEEKREYEKPPNLEEKRDKKENQNDRSKTPILNGGNGYIIGMRRISRSDMARPAEKSLQT